MKTKSDYRFTQKQVKQLREDPRNLSNTSYPCSCVGCENTVTYLWDSQWRKTGGPSYRWVKGRWEPGWTIYTEPTCHKCLSAGCIPGEPCKCNGEVKGR